MATLVLAAASFVAVYLGRRTKVQLLAQYVLKSAKRIYGAPAFRFNAVADGINQLRFSSHRGLGPPVLGRGSQFLLLPFDL